MRLLSRYVKQNYRLDDSYTNSLLPSLSIDSIIVGFEARLISRCGVVSRCCTEAHVIGFILEASLQPYRLII